MILKITCAATWNVATMAGDTLPGAKTEDRGEKRECSTTVGLRGKAQVVHFLVGIN